MKRQKEGVTILSHPFQSLFKAFTSGGSISTSRHTLFKKH